MDSRFFLPLFFILIFHLKPSMCIDVSTVYPVLYMLAVSLSGSADVLAAFVVIIMLFFFFFFFCNTRVLSFCSNPTQNGRTKKKTEKKGEKSEIDIFAQIAVNKDWWMGRHLGNEKFA